MPLINWNTNLSVNVQEMDDQHKILIGIINQLHEAMRAGKGSEEVVLITEQMINYAHSHFKAEERILVVKSYPGFTQQKSEHDVFLKKALGFKNDVAQGKMALSVPVSNFLREWLVNHIQVEDKKYGMFLNSRGIL